MGYVLVIGSINTDLSINTERFPTPGETLNGSSFKIGCGGKGANQAIAAAKQGANVKFLGCVGEDVFGSAAIKNLEDSGVDILNISRVACSTGVAVITVSGGDNEIIIDAGANAHVTPDLVKENEKLIKNADCVLMQLEIPLESVCEAARLAKKHGVKVLLNPAPAKELPKELLENISLCVPNEHEAAILTGIEVCDEKSARAALKKLSGLSGEAIITLGENGSIYTDGKTVIKTDAFKTKAIDTTAAGDCFIAAYLSRSLSGYSNEESLKFASAASVLTVSRRGAAESVPSLAETEEYLLKHTS